MEPAMIESLLKLGAAGILCVMWIYTTKANAEERKEWRAALEVLITATRQVVADNTAALNRNSEILGRNSEVMSGVAEVVRACRTPMATAGAIDPTGAPYRRRRKNGIAKTHEE